MKRLLGKQKGKNQTKQNQQHPPEPMSPRKGEATAIAEKDLLNSEHEEGDFDYSFSQQPSGDRTEESESRRRDERGGTTNKNDPGDHYDTYRDGESDSESTMYHSSGGSQSSGSDASYRHFDDEEFDDEEYDDYVGDDSSYYSDEVSEPSSGDAEEEEEDEEDEYLRRYSFPSDPPMVEPSDASHQVVVLDADTDAHAHAHAHEHEGEHEGEDEDAGDSTINHSGNTTLENSKSNSNSNSGSQEERQQLQQQKLQQKQQQQQQRPVFQGGNSASKQHQVSGDDPPQPTRQEVKKKRGLFGRLFGGGKKDKGKGKDQEKSKIKNKAAVKSLDTTSTDKGSWDKTNKTESSTENRLTSSDKTKKTGTTKKRKDKSKKKKKSKKGGGDGDSYGSYEDDVFSEIGPRLMDDDSELHSSYDYASQILMEQMNSQPPKNELRSSKTKGQPSTAFHQYQKGRKQQQQQHQQQQQQRHQSQMPGVAEHEEYDIDDDEYHHRGLQPPMSPVMEEIEEDQTVDDSSRFYYGGGGDDSSAQDIHSLIRTNRLAEYIEESSRALKGDKVAPLATKSKPPLPTNHGQTPVVPVQSLPSGFQSSVGTNSGTSSPTGESRQPYSVVQIYELQSEVSKLKSLVSLLTERMELYERQSECLVEACLEHNTQWKIACLDKYDRSSKRRAAQSSSVVRLSTIKGLMEENALTDQWIKQLETVQRSYQERLDTTQSQLKTLRYEQILTNKQIMDLKREKSKAKSSVVSASQKAPVQLAGGSAPNNSTKQKGPYTASPQPSYHSMSIDAKDKPSKNPIDHLIIPDDAYKPPPKPSTSSLVQDMMSNWQDEGNHATDAVKTGRRTPNTSFLTSKGGSVASSIYTGMPLNMNDPSLASTLGGVGGSTYTGSQLSNTLTPSTANKSKKDGKKKKKKKKKKSIKKTKSSSSSSITTSIE
eukprot:CAMPEP_0172388518 /NCGR_PEP_ID=MMETSP1061-20121228/5608_1 /TAXON_ID=37318 /ORGANISM="Pseudo-nitzschia pungens, Strain cf. pungens" /LENGTH=933 /DNA_ID=CAMNT_0013118433 /DNA_START=40 /DNA_END=2841 /DNA_ORIENTATION=+